VPERIKAIFSAAKGMPKEWQENTFASALRHGPALGACCQFCGMCARHPLVVQAMLVISIVLEAAVAIVAALAVRKGKPYIYGLAFTFGAYVLYDLARLLQWDVQGGLLSGLFLLATVTALIAVWGLYRD
jgi:hypothetical protein